MRTRKTMVRAGRADIRVTEAGDGPSLLLLHGNPDSGDLWLPVARRLPDFRCVFPDLPGLGRSAVPRDYSWSLANMSRFVAELVEKIRLAPPVHLVVHDFGGPFGLAWAADHPEQVGTVTCINTLFFHDYSWHFWARVWRTPVLGKLAMAGWCKPLVVHEMRRGSKKLTRQQAALVHAGVGPDMRQNVLALYRAATPALFRDRERRFLAARLPVQVLWGTRDPYIPERFADRFGARKVMRYPGYGHWLPAEAPEEVAARVRAFALEAGAAGL